MKLLPATFAAILLGLCPAPARAEPFPRDDDGCYRVNVLRRFDAEGKFLPRLESTLAGAGNIFSPVQNAIAGGAELAQWDDVADNSAATLRIALDTEYALRKFEVLHGQHTPDMFEIGVSASGFDKLLPVVPLTKAESGLQTLRLPSAVRAKYVQYRWQGKGASPYVQLQELRAFADAAMNPFSLDDSGGYDLVATGHVTATLLGDGAGWSAGDSAATLVDRDPRTYLRGSGVEGTDAQVLIDLGAVYPLVAVSLSFYHGQAWDRGAKIELSETGTDYRRVFLQKSKVESQIVSFPRTASRYVRITNYHSRPGAWTDFQAFAVSTPATK